MVLDLLMDWCPAFSCLKSPKQTLISSAEARSEDESLHQLALYPSQPGHHYSPLSAIALRLKPDSPNGCDLIENRVLELSGMPVEGIVTNVTFQAACQGEAT
jgi:hypothetical protein